jgi:hypothetical protein
MPTARTRPGAEAFETFRDRLQQELGVAELETLRLYDAICLQRAGASLRCPRPKRPRRRRPLSNPQAVDRRPAFQAAGDDPSPSNSPTA